MDLASTEIHGYRSCMNELIEAGDPRTKVVGKRRPPAAGSDADWTQFNQLQQNFHRMWGSLPCPKGVYRFTSFEQFDEWKTNLMIRNAPGRQS
jgi:hypothetical protein